jgi:anti-anti-sigma regulatory factor
VPEAKIFDIETDDKIVIINVNFDPSIDADLIILNQIGQVREFIKEINPVGVLFDFSQSGYFGSCMLEAVLEIWNLVKELEKSQMIICELSEIGTEIIELSKLDTLWTIKPTRKESIEILKGQNSAS